MVKNPKIISLKTKWRSTRQRYTWHLVPPSAETFERSHWWNGRTDVGPAAALYEVARRHPLVGEVRRASVNQVASFWNDPHCPAQVMDGRLNAMMDQIVRERKLPPSFNWTCRFGLKSWASLDYADRKHWCSSIGRMKGLDFRDEVEQCRAITQGARWQAVAKRKAALVKKGAISKDHLFGDEPLRILRKHLADCPITAKEMETEIAKLAVAAHRRGEILLSVVPDLDLATEKAGALLVNTYRICRLDHPASTPRQRARNTDWLHVISEFEDAEITQDKVRSPLFFRYRRLIDGVRFLKVSR